MKKIYFTFALVLLTCTFAHASELLLRINRKGQFIVSASSQTQTNNFNTYQFYNLYGGTTQVKVVDKLNGQVIFKNNLHIPEGYQLIAELDIYGTMTIVANNPLANSNGGWSNNVGTINYGNGNYSGGNQNNHCGTYPNYQGDGYYNQGQSTNNYFNQFVTSLRNESFDSNRLQNAKVYAAKTNLSANQIKEIAATFTFDSNRLDWAKAAYGSCYDKGNYFLLRETFTFSSSYSDLQDYISVQ
ncbi:MAG: hypothetical protein K0S23_3537 [Fluviicola sp.]|jgi:hypothetical protein|uniref:DUF4476 domain-containing protein n=1 Tax=Fluviicola sp. TaxID=1917219 RepID=UPI002617E548|nr:DUF4476 domain-containing protein [Fluviicola sp.]MDF3029230.1 hypothetical protein [Fluviicola sp.]